MLEPEDIERKLQAVRKWQACDQVHPLTCAYCRSKLDPVFFHSLQDVGLVCPDCHYTQLFVPESVYSLASSLDNPESVE